MHLTTPGLPIHPHALQLRWVKQSLQSVRYHGWKAGRQAATGGTARDGLQHQASWPGFFCMLDVHAAERGSQC